MGLYHRKDNLIINSLLDKFLKKIEYLRNKRRHYGRHSLGNRVHKVDVQVLPVFGAVLVLMQRLDGILIKVRRDGPTRPALPLVFQPVSLGVVGRLAGVVVDDLVGVILVRHLLQQ